MHRLKFNRNNILTNKLKNKLQHPIIKIARITQSRISLTILTKVIYPQAPKVVK